MTLGGGGGGGGGNVNVTMTLFCLEMPPKYIWSLSSQYSLGGYSSVHRSGAEGFNRMRVALWEAYIGDLVVPFEMPIYVNS